MTAYPRDVSPKVIQRLLDNSEAYGIFKIPDPEEEEEVEDAEESTQVEEEATAESDEGETVEDQ